MSNTTCDSSTFDFQDSGLVDLVLALNCPYVNRSQSRESILSWLQSIDENKQEKRLLLEWIFQVTGTNSGSLVDSFLQLGIFESESECKEFLDGKTKKKFSQKVWSNLFSFLYNQTQVLLSDEDCLEKKEYLDSFMDTVLQEINLRDQLDKPVPILDFALEKELAKSKTSGSVPRSALETILSKVEEERNNLTSRLEEKGDSSSLNITADGSVDNDNLRKQLELLTAECDQLRLNSTNFSAKYDQELKPVIKSTANQPHLAAVPHPELADFSEISGDMKKFLHGANVIHQQIMSLQEQKGASTS